MDKYLLILAAMIIGVMLVGVPQAYLNNADVNLAVQACRPHGGIERLYALPQYEVVCKGGYWVHLREGGR